MSSPPQHPPQSSIFCPSSVFIFSIFTLTAISAKSTQDSIDFTQYHNYAAVEELFKQLEDLYPSLAQLHTIGQSVQGRELYVLRITENVKESRALGRPMFKYVANMHGNEAVGRELVVNLAQYLLINYKESDAIGERITKLVNETELWLMPSLNPDGFEMAKEGNCYQVSAIFYS